MLGTVHSEAEPILPLKFFVQCEAEHSLQATVEFFPYQNHVPVKKVKYNELNLTFLLQIHNKLEFNLLGYHRYNDDIYLQYSYDFTKTFIQIHLVINCFILPWDIIKSYSLLEH